MINFDALSLKAFLEENKEYFTEARIQKIQQPTRQEFVFWLRNLSESRKLYVSINPKYFHLCFMSKENEERRFIEIPKSPPMFCMLLRKYLEGARITKVNQPKNERILEFYIEVQNEFAQTIYLCLAIELMGKHSNVVLYNYDTNVIIGCAHNVGAEKSREREMAGTLPYIYPPRQNKKDISKISFDEFFQDIKISTGDIYKAVAEKYFGLSQPFSKQICEYSGIFSDKSYLKSNLEKLYLNLLKYLELKNLSPCISADKGEFSLFSELLHSCELQPSVNCMIDNYFTYHFEAEKIRAFKSKLMAQVNSRMKKAKNTLEKLQKQLKSCEKSDMYRKKGDLIMSNLYSNKDYSKFIEVVDYETGLNVKIDLDDAQTLKENANRYYKLYNKSKTTSNKALELMENLEAEKKYLEQVVYSIACSKKLQDCFEIEDEISVGENQKMKKELKKKKEKLLDSLISVNFEGFTIYVGKNNKQNDYIVSKLSKDEDLWFHTRDCAGSHVLLKLENAQEPTDGVLLKCAQLAKEHSAGKDSSKVGVIYTKRKFLKKPPGANLGYVTYKGEKEIVID